MSLSSHSFVNCFFLLCGLAVSFVDSRSHCPITTSLLYSHILISSHWSTSYQTRSHSTHPSDRICSDIPIMPYISFTKDGRSVTNVTPTSRLPPPAPLTRYRIFKNAPYWYAKPLPPLPKYDRAVELDSTELPFPPPKDTFPPQRRKPLSAYTAYRSSTVYELEGSSVPVFELEAESTVARKASISSLATAESDESEVDFALISSISNLHSKMTCGPSLSPISSPIPSSPSPSLINTLPKCLQIQIPTAPIRTTFPTPTLPKPIREMKRQSFHRPRSVEIRKAPRSLAPELQLAQSEAYCRPVLTAPFRGSAYLGYGHVWRFI